MKLQVPGEDAGHRNSKMHPELGSGLSFENSPGGVRVDFSMARDALDAFARMRKPNDGTTIQLAVRRGGQDLVMTLR